METGATLANEATSCGEFQDDSKSHASSRMSGEMTMNCFAKSGHSPSGNFAGWEAKHELVLDWNVGTCPFGGSRQRGCRGRSKGRRVPRPHSSPEDRVLPAGSRRADAIPLRRLSLWSLLRHDSGRYGVAAGRRGDCGEFAPSREILQVHSRP